MTFFGWDYSFCKSTVYWPILKHRLECRRGKRKEHKGNGSKASVVMSLGGWFKREDINIQKGWWIVFYRQNFMIIKIFVVRMPLFILRRPLRTVLGAVWLPEPVWKIQSLPRIESRLSIPQPVASVISKLPKTYWVEGLRNFQRNDFVMIWRGISSN